MSVTIKSFLFFALSKIHIFQHGISLSTKYFTVFLLIYFLTPVLFLKDLICLKIIFPGIFLLFGQYLYHQVKKFVCLTVVYNLKDMFNGLNTAHHPESILCLVTNVCSALVEDNVMNATKRLLTQLSG